MEKEEIRRIVLEGIDRLNLSLFYFTDIKKVLEDHINKENDVENPVEIPSAYEDILNEVLRDLVAERKISPIPHGANAAFFVNKKH